MTKPIGVVGHFSALWLAAMYAEHLRGDCKTREHCLYCAAEYERIEAEDRHFDRLRREQA